MIGRTLMGVILQIQCFSQYDRSMLTPHPKPFDGMLTSQPVSDTLQMIADKMRDYSRGIIAHRTEIAGDDVTHTAPFLGSMVSWLDKTARNRTSCVALDNLRLAGKVKAYKSDVLIQVVMRCHYLKSAGH